ncbi:uncharacterized protein [Clytia hemisphaerica]|uniref:Amino acid transporter transmembrane domain-containing protein n=1 Tax=Clytia hemisphaerica TaxID=252671 RepID=A0A7M5XCE6_9CNID
MKQRATNATSKMEQEALLPPSAIDESFPSDSEFSTTGSVSGATDKAKKRGAENIFQAINLLLRRNTGEDGSLAISTAFLIMVSMSYGSAVIILPYTLQQLGPLLWLLFTVGCFLILAFCAVMLKESCVHIMLFGKDRISRSLLVRRPYPTIAEYSVGKRFSKVVEATMYVALGAEVLAYGLLGATSMNRVIPLWLEGDDRIRIWLLIGFFVMLPFMMVGTYSDLTMPAFVAVFTSFLASLCIFIVSVVAKYYYGARTSSYKTITLVKEEHIFKIFGEILFAAAGPALLLPNIVVLLKKPEKFQTPILFSHLCVVLLYALLAIVPFIIFGQTVEASIIDTLQDAILALKMSPVWLSVITLASISLAIHFTMVTVLCANPIFLNLENKFNIPPEFTWKRFALRSSIALAFVLVDIMIPYFSPVISIVGALPLALLCIIYPIIVYFHTFEKKSNYMKLFLGFVLCLTFALMIGNTIFSIWDIVVYFELPSFKAVKHFGNQTVKDTWRKAALRKNFTFTQL